MDGERRINIDIAFIEYPLTSPILPIENVKKKIPSLFCLLDYFTPPYPSPLAH